MTARAYSDFQNNDLRHVHVRIEQKQLCVIGIAVIIVPRDLVYREGEEEGTYRSLWDPIFEGYVGFCPVGEVGGEPL